jgi:cellulose synthase/poly-beta-1,6-N-acetylglucosamine synthase-like glycosyltransferase
VLKADLTWLSYVLAVFGLYYLFLYASIHWRRWRDRSTLDASYAPLVCVVIPCHNEEQVIGHTVEALLKQDYDDTLVIVMNDGSKDRTSQVAHSYADEGVVVVDRGPDIAGRGKGAVLNHAYGMLCEMVERKDPVLGGRSADDIVICVIDADGQLESSVLSMIAPYFGDPVVGGLQIGVRIANCDANFLTRMQDLEFVGFSAMVQEARDAWGSVGLGGNGQFTRLSALLSVGSAPWSDCLTEDLDLGLTLVKEGWRIRFCPTAWVAQQAVERYKPLFRQRTRWIQGHYQCWRHFPSLMSKGSVKLRTRADLAVYMFMGCYIWLVIAGPILGILSTIGLIEVHTTFLLWVPEGALRNTLRLFLSIAPFLVFILVYQARAAEPFKGRWLPAIGFIFTAYSYTMIVSQVWALARIAVGRGAWAKTARVKSESAV